MLRLQGADFELDEREFEAFGDLAEPVHSGTR
jgi:hypothetical protein